MARLKPLLAGILLSGALSFGAVAAGATQIPLDSAALADFNAAFKAGALTSQKQRSALAEPVLAAVRQWRCKTVRRWLWK